MTNKFNGEEINNSFAYRYTSDKSSLPFSNISFGTPPGSPFENYDVIVIPDPLQSWWSKIWNGEDHWFYTIDYLKEKLNG